MTERSFIRLKRIAGAGPCRDGMTEAVLAVADGSEKSPGERARVLSHLAECDACRFLFVDYFLCAEGADDAAEEDGPARALPRIPLSLMTGGLVPLDMTYAAASSPAAVLGGAPRSVMEYDIELLGEKALLRAIKAGRRVKIELSVAGGASRYYLLGEGFISASTPHNGVVAFDLVGPGRYLVSRDMKGFVVLDIEEAA